MARFGRGYIGRGALGPILTNWRVKPTPPVPYHAIDGGRGFLPQLLVEIDFGNDPTSTTRGWADVTTDVRQLTYTRSGRTDDLQRAATGSLSLLLDNRDGVYDQTNTSSPYYPNVKRMRWVRVRAQWNEIEYARWQGLVESWEQDWPENGKDATVTIRAADALKVLNLYDLGGQQFSAQRTDQRVTAVCSAAGFVSSVSTGVSSVVDSGTLSTGTSALSHLQQVEETENGRLFAAADATITFQDRHYRLQNSSASRGTIGDAAGEIPYRDVSLASDDQNVWNRVLVTPSGGTVETAQDSTSQASYYERTYTRSLLTSSQSEALTAAEYLISVYKDPAPKLPALALLPARATGFWPTVLAAENGQRFTFRRRPPWGGTIETDGFVEQITDTIVPGASWDVRLQLSAAVDQSFWVLGDASYSLLGQTTSLIY